MTLSWRCFDFRIELEDYAPLLLLMPPLLENVFQDAGRLIRLISRSEEEGENPSKEYFSSLLHFSLQTKIFEPTAITFWLINSFPFSFHEIRSVPFYNFASIAILSRGKGQE